jgi:WhiB family redox-sensing transcriptional regulator
VHAIDPPARIGTALNARQSWIDDAPCAEIGGDVFFPEHGTPVSSARAAKRICARCPVRPECLAYALEHNERYGVWGGLSERERRKLGYTTRDDVA